MSSLKKFKNKKKGFTLIELIVVIAIIGILAAILLPRFGGFTDKAREKSAISEAKAVYTTLESVYAEEGNYPDDLSTVEGIKNTTKITNYNKLATGNGVLFKYKIDGKTKTLDCTASGDITVTN